MEPLKKRRKELGITQKELADSVGTTCRVIQYYEAGEREPSVKNAIAIAKVLKTTVEKLFS
jgi:DNA-binding XRE family transcriptional regulator